MKNKIGQKQKYFFASQLNTFLKVYMTKNQKWKQNQNFKWIILYVYKSVKECMSEYVLLKMKFAHFQDTFSCEFVWLQNMLKYFMDSFQIF